MSAFAQGLQFGFAQGMFNNMFGFGGFGGFGGFWGNPFGCCSMPSLFNMPPLFMMPMPNFTNIYTCPAITPQVNLPQYNGTLSFDTYVPRAQTVNNIFVSQATMDTSVYSTPLTGDTFTKKKENEKEKKTEIEKQNTTNTTNTTKTKSTKTTGITSAKTESSTRRNNNFDIMMNYIFEREGGYNPDDCGQPGNYGVLQSSYDTYRKQKGLPTQPVSKLTKEEARDLYYQNYYLASGADKISNPTLALQVFDTAVNMGVKTAKELRASSGDDVNKFEELRIAKYESIAENNPGKKQYLNAWKNRVSKTHDYASGHLIA